jgi:hypothetical protein
MHLMPVGMKSSTSRRAESTASTAPLGTILLELLLLLLLGTVLILLTVGSHWSGVETE